MTLKTSLMTLAEVGGSPHPPADPGVPTLTDDLGRGREAAHTCPLTLGSKASSDSH